MNKSVKPISRPIDSAKLNQSKEESQQQLVEIELDQAETQILERRSYKQIDELRSVTKNTLSLAQTQPRKPSKRPLKMERQLNVVQPT